MQICNHLFLCYSCTCQNECIAQLALFPFPLSNVCDELSPCLLMSPIPPLYLSTCINMCVWARMLEWVHCSACAFLFSSFQNVWWIITMFLDESYPPPLSLYTYTYVCENAHVHTFICNFMCVRAASMHIHMQFLLKQGILCGFGWCYWLHMLPSVY